MLSLSSEPQQLVELVQDKLFQVLDIDSCWVQLLDPESRELRLTGCRGFTSRMRYTIGLKDSAHGLSDRVVMGHRVFIPDLSRDGVYGLSTFTEAGLRSLIAVPIRTYRTHGIVGIAGRARKQFPAEAVELLVVIAGMLGAALNTAELSRLALATRERLSGPGQQAGIDFHDEAPGGGAAPELAADPPTGEDGGPSQPDGGEGLNEAETIAAIVRQPPTSAALAPVAEGSSHEDTQPSPESPPDPAGGGESDVEAGPAHGVPWRPPGTLAWPGSATEEPPGPPTTAADQAASDGPFEQHGRRMAGFRRSHRRE